jgi:hypothetical protein
MNTTVNKPLILVRQECFESLVKVIDDSNLPAFIIEPMLKDLLKTIQHNMKVEYNQTLAWYMTQLQNQSENTENVETENQAEQVIDSFEGIEE